MIRLLGEQIQNAIREVPDFPKPGINFKDITPILADHVLSRDIVQEFKRQFSSVQVDGIVGVESRGFLFGMMLAQELKVPFIAVRKQGKLPYKVVSHSYDLEYGSAVMEMHIDSIQPGMNVLVHDDLLATGGTAAAAAELIKIQGGTICGFGFIIELEFLKGADKLRTYSDKIVNLVSY